MAHTMLNVYDPMTHRKTAVLQNAFEIIETHELNQIYDLTFTMPATDEKVSYCLPRHFVRWGDTGELYRIKDIRHNNSNTGTVEYECEHVVTTLCDSLLFGSFTYGGGSIKTSDVIIWLLEQQKTRNWVLGTCDFDRKFEYGWEQENILNALYAIPKEFSTPYKWVFDTTAYPWKISLKVIDSTVHPEYYLRAESNILSSGTEADYADICTRIYPLGYGEGVNQLTIRDVNSGIPYLQSPDAVIREYGLVEKVLVDRRFENPESLKAYAQTMLDNLQTPGFSREFDVTDLYPLTSQSLDDAEVGKICRMTGDGSIAYITKTVHRWDEAGSLQIELSTKASDVASRVADLAERVRIESVYAQGATQLYQHSKDANATPSNGMTLNLYFPSEMRQINKILMRMSLQKFRSYSLATENAGASTRTSSEGGASTQTSTSGGASTQTSTEGGRSTQTSTDGGGSTYTSSSGGDSTQTSTDGGGSTYTSSSGGGTGTTSTNDGGSGVSVSATVAETSDANWSKRSNPYTNTTEPKLHINSADAHSHSIWGYTGAVTPPASLNYQHDHAINFSSGEAGSHRHDGTVDAHNHTIPRTNLAHNHSVTINVNNSSGKSGFSHNHTFSLGSHTHTVQIPNHNHSIRIPQHNHTVTIPNHTHNVTVPDHTHQVSIPNHTHNVTIPNHTHTIEIPAHSHEITAGIFESGNPTAFDIYVNGTRKTTVNAKTFDGDITSWLLNASNQIPRDTWIDVEIRPNDLAYVVCSVFVQGFVQSRGGGNY